MATVSSSSPPSLPPEALALATRLFQAARSGDGPLLQQALTHNPRIANLTNSSGDTLLMLSSYHGHIPLTKLLLQEFNADPNVLNARGQSPLAGSVFKGEDEICRLLLEGGADPDLGQPSAQECLGIFSKEDVWGEEFGRARDRLKHKANGVGNGVENSV